MIPKSTDGKTRVLSLSYGKDSLACLGACEELGLPLDRIVHAEVWATDTIPADLPPMVEFKAKADRIIKERWGFSVEHLCANRGGAILTYEKYFFHRLLTGKFAGSIKGFPMQRHPWCQQLKVGYGASLTKGNLSRHLLPAVSEEGQNIRFPDSEGKLVYGTKNQSTKFSKDSEGEVVQYLGIASDEPKRIERHKDREGFVLPLVEIGWTEADAKQWCIENDLLSPIYTDECLRGGCWFCHNQGVNALRNLRHDYPDLWAILLQWDSDSPTSFRADGHTVHDFDKRFELEDEGLIRQGDVFRWSMLNDDLNYRLF